MTSSAPKILITGGAGQLASALQAHPNAGGFNLVACPRAQLDITDATSIAQALAKYSPDIIINTAAYTAVDLAEQNTEEALHINHVGPKNLAQACKQQSIPLIHLSTDYIFDGNSSKPYKEDDATHPINHYGLSKWLGEQAIREHCEKYIILRVSGVFSGYGKNFYKTILKLATEKPELRIVADQITCPTDASDIAATLFSMANDLSTWGTFHYCSTPEVSWHQFASAIIETARKKNPLLTAVLTAIPSADYKTAAKRPRYSVLDCAKIKSAYGVDQPSWQAALTVRNPS